MRSQACAAAKLPMQVTARDTEVEMFLAPVRKSRAKYSKMKVNPTEKSVAAFIRSSCPSHFAPMLEKTPAWTQSVVRASE
ncbi:MAG: hypothetical protein AAF394_10615, partial [Planctomycetota bacterium]